MAHDISAVKTTMGWTAGQLGRCDPYLLWADVSSNAVTDDDGCCMVVLVELKRDEQYSNFRDRMNHGGTIHWVPNSLEQERSGARFVSGLTSVTGLQRLVNQVIGHKVDGEVQREIERFTLQQSRTDISQATNWAAEIQKNLGTSDPLDGWASAAPSDNGHEGSFVGIIDDGFPLHLCHPLSLGTERSLQFWDQGWTRRGAESTAAMIFKPWWQNPWGWAKAAGAKDATFRGFLYGRELKELPAPGPDFYAGMRYFHPTPRHSHGAAVLGLAAPWVGSRRSPVAWPEYISGLALVQLPTRTVDDTSGGSLATHVLDGVRYILWQEEMSRPPGGRARPVVVNVSYGVHAGPHDGTSMFERALSELLDKNANLDVVLPAGNSHLARCHARRTLGRTKKEETLHLRVQPDNASDTHVEFWLPADARVRLSVKAPGGETMTIERGESKVCCDLADEGEPTLIRFAATYAPAVAQSNGKTMILLSIGATRNDLTATGQGTAPGLNGKPRRAVLGCPGLWQLTVTNLGGAEVDFDAWVERDDAAPDRSHGSRQAHFLEQDATPEGTLNGIATLRHTQVHVVGAMRVDGSLSPYSAANRAGSDQPGDAPHVVAPADWSPAVSGLRTIGLAPGAVSRINGTSAACAVYARDFAWGAVVAGPSQRAIGTARSTPPEHQDRPVADANLRGLQHRRHLRFDIDP